MAYELMNAMLVQIIISYRINWSPNNRFFRYLGTVKVILYFIASHFPEKARSLPSIVLKLILFIFYNFRL